MKKPTIQKPLTCAMCPAPLIQPRRGGRTKHFCSDKCRKKANRIYRRYKHEESKANLLRSLRKKWEQFDHPTTVFTFEHIVKVYGVGAAALATDALEQELKARVENPIMQAQFARQVRHQMEVAEHASRSTSNS